MPEDEIVAPEGEDVVVPAAPAADDAEVEEEEEADAAPEVATDDEAA